MIEEDILKLARLGDEMRKRPEKIKITHITNSILKISTPYNNKEAK